MAQSKKPNTTAKQNKSTQKPTTQEGRAPLFTVRSWQKTQNENGVIINLSALVGNGWENVRAYVPFEINVNENKRYKTTIARKITAKTTGNVYMALYIPVEKCYKENEDEQQSNDEDADIPF